MGETGLSRRRPHTLRLATFNVSLFGQREGQMAASLAKEPGNRLRLLTEVIASVDPDVLVINELDYDSENKALDAFRTALELQTELSSGYDHARAFPSNTGLTSGFDLVGSGKLSAPENAWGFGRFPGQYAFALLSRFPIRTQRSFQHFPWVEMPENRMPRDFYPKAAEAILPLSSKNHVDLTLDVAGLGNLHLLLSHPTPPVFDGPEQRNKRRNHDEIQFWTDYLGGQDYVTDDAGLRGGLASEERFVILGDLNADPSQGDAEQAAIKSLLAHPQIQDPLQQGYFGTATADFREKMRVDYLLPCSDLVLGEGGVLWWDPKSPEARLNKASDHHLVWQDIRLAV